MYITKTKNKTKKDNIVQMYLSFNNIESTGSRYGDLDEIVIVVAVKLGAQNWELC